MACPDCGSPAGDLRFATSVETHGLDCGPYERFDEEFIVCGGCGGRFDVCDWDCTPELQFEVDVAPDSTKAPSIPAEPISGRSMCAASYLSGQPDGESGKQSASYCGSTTEIQQ